MIRVFASILLVFALAFSPVSQQYVAATLPTKYDMRDPNGDGRYNDTLLTPIKTQGKNGVCWAFASIGALEAILKKNTGKEYDLSEEHMRFLLSDKTPSTELKFKRAPADGGNDMQAAAYLTLRKGPVNEKAVSYTIGNEIPSNLDILPEFNLKRVICIDNKIINIKNAIMDYSGVITGMYSDISLPINAESQYYNPNKSAYFSNAREEVNHSIMIVGWDDNYSKNNFNIKPKNNGAWIVRNSWGTQIGFGGYIYLSYEDSVLTNSAAEFTSFDGLEAAVKNEKLYYHDPFGKTGAQGLNNTKNLYVANVFTKDDNNVEKIKSVIYFDAGYVDRYEIYIVKLDSSGILPEIDQLERPDLVINSTFTGYNTVDLPIPVSIQKGEFAIIFNAIKDDYGNCHFGVETSIDNYATISANADESFIYNSGWIDIGKLKNINYNIRAITEHSQNTTNSPIVKPQSIPNISDQKPNIPGVTDKWGTATDSNSNNPLNILKTAVEKYLFILIIMTPVFIIFTIYYIYKMKKRGE